MASLCIISGRANSGKSQELTKLLFACQKVGGHGIYIVPEQSTFETEKLLTESFGGMIGTEVLSFSRLSERILSQSGQHLPYLSKQGRNMVIRKIVMENQGALLLYGKVARSDSFADRIDLLISQLKQSRITPEMLKKLLPELNPRSILSQKLHDVCLLYQRSEEFLSSRFLTANDELPRATELLPSSFASGAEVFIDGFDNPSRALYEFFEALLRVAKSVTIALRLDPRGREPLFLPDEKIARRLIEIAERNDIPYTLRTRRAEDRLDALSHLEKNLFSNEPKPFQGKAEELALYAMSDRRAEAENLADLVLMRAKEGVRYKDMAIACPDLEAYTPLIRRAFAKRNIPLFFDSKRGVRTLGAMRFVLSSVKAAASGYAMQQVLALVKSGFFEIERDEAEKFENYVLRYGLFGSSLTSPLSFGEVPAEAEKVRQTIMPPLMELHEGLRGRSAEEKLVALSRYLEKTGYLQQIKGRAERLLAEGRGADAQVLSSLSTILSEMFTQLRVIMGATPLSMNEFCTLMEQGAAAYDVGTVPNEADAVMLCDLERSRLQRTDTLFLLGCNEGLVPRSISDDAILCDSELATLGSLGLMMWNDTIQKAQNDRLELYSVLCKAKKRLIFSYACSESGAALAPSLLIMRLLHLFPQLRAASDLSLNNSLPLCRRTGFSVLSNEYCRAQRSGTQSMLLSSLIEIFSKDEQYAPALKRILEHRSVNVSPPPLKTELALSLYGRGMSMSASRLELFNKCPFAHFSNYGLRAKERKEAKEEASDIGTFVHDVLDAFVRYIAEKGMSYEDIDDKRADEIVDILLPERVRAHNDGIFLNNVRLKESLFLIELRIKLACRSIACQVRLGSFKPLHSEYRFGSDEVPPIRLLTAEGRTVSLRGIIDRIDGAEVEGERLLRVIDYKLGRRKLEPERIESGETLQLPLYLAAARQLSGEGVGMYYMPTTLLTREDEEEGLLHSLFGVTASDKHSLEAAEHGSGAKSAYISGLNLEKGSGAVCTREELSRIVHLALEVSKSTVDRIYRGQLSVLPTKDACKYCPYVSACGFDEKLGCTRRKIPAKKLKDLVGGEKE
ncbi:MAG: PD-(D/E)XK nuclease family protein [Clostridia bacterium]|nr:PD-(D/E)XK nuclease family protein [Clostridia bacterium]